MDGIEATLHIRKLQETETARVPIVAVTANVLPEDRDRCMSAGMDGFVPKPVRLEMLRQVLIEQCGEGLAAGAEAETSGTP